MPMVAVTTSAEELCSIATMDAVVDANESTLDSTIATEKQTSNDASIVQDRADDGTDPLDVNTTESVTASITPPKEDPATAATIKIEQPASEQPATPVQEADVLAYSNSVPSATDISSTTTMAASPVGMGVTAATMMTNTSAPPSALLPSMIPGPSPFHDANYPATDPPLENRPGANWPAGFSPSLAVPCANGEIIRPGPLAGGQEYRLSTHPFKIFCGGVPLLANERNVFDLFEREVGTVACVQLPRAQTHNGVMQLGHAAIPKYHRGYAFVTFQTAELRDRAMSRRLYRLFDRTMELKMMDGQHRRPSISSMGPGHATHDPDNVPAECKLFVALRQHRTPGVAPQEVNLDESHLLKHFGHYGKIKKVIVVREKHTGIGKGYGFVYYDDTSGPMTALTAGREHLIDGHINTEIKPFAPTPSGTSTSRMNSYAPALPGIPHLPYGGRQFLPQAASYGAAHSSAGYGHTQFAAGVHPYAMVAPPPPANLHGHVHNAQSVMMSHHGLVSLQSVVPSTPSPSTAATGYHQSPIQTSHQSHYHPSAYGAMAGYHHAGHSGLETAVQVATRQRPGSHASGADVFGTR